jgi:hypothetical protein
MFGVYVFILCLYSPVFRQRPCDELITRPRSPTVSKSDHETEKQRPGPTGAVEPVKKKMNRSSTREDNYNPTYVIAESRSQLR